MRTNLLGELLIEEEQDGAMKLFYVIAGAALFVMPRLVSADTPDRYSAATKVSPDAQTVQFVRPGLSIKILSAKIGSDATTTVIYSIPQPARPPPANTTA